MCALTWRATVMTLVVASQMMLGPLSSTGIVTVHSFEEGEIEKNLNRLNKPAVKSITLEDGDIIDCVDIYKQPALDHPLLKNHKIRMWPSFLPKPEKSAEASHPRPLLQPMWQKSEGCPDGTIPIRKVQKDDLIRATSAEILGRRRIAGVGTIESAEVVLDNGGPYGAAEGRISIWRVPVENNEWSTAHLQISDGNMYSIESGWMVNPIVSGDGNTRLYAYWTADGGQKSGCFNMLCPGFVQIKKDYVLGVQIANASVYEGLQYDIGIKYLKDEFNNIWWLMVESLILGYWPEELFGDENGFPMAPTVSWGGSILNMNRGWHHTNTKMGSGHHARVRWNRAAYIKDAGATGKSNDTRRLPPPPHLLKSFADNGHCYSVLINLNPIDPNFMYFGGPGGDCVPHA